MCVCEVKERERENVCVRLLGDVLGKRGKMVKIGENRLWEAFCPLHMHTITQAAVWARPQAVIPQPNPHSITRLSRGTLLFMWIVFFLFFWFFIIIIFFFYDLYTSICMYTTKDTCIYIVVQVTT